MQSSIQVMTLFVVCMLCGCGEPFTSQPASVVAPSQVSPSPKPPSSPAPQGLSGPTGSYTLTLTASPSCEVVNDSVSGQTMPLPDSVRLRRYDAQFADGAGKLTALDGTGNQVSVGGIDHYIYSGQPLMFVTGNELTIIVPPADGWGYIKSTPTCAGGDYWWEVFSNLAGDNQVFEQCGTWRGSMDNPDRIDGTINGSFGYYRGVGPNWKTDLFCQAPDHHFTLAKR